MAMTPSSDPKADILSRYHLLVQEWNQNAAQISSLQQKQAEISQRAMDFVGAARVFGFDLETDYREWAAEIANIYATPYPTPGTATPITLVTPTARNRTVRDLILELAEQ